MKINNAQLSYCTNIHGGESWVDHFDQLQQHVPEIKKAVSPDAAFGLGLRLAAKACAELRDPIQLEAFKAWLKAQDCYVFTMNGFPYGDFHTKRVKDKVHFPDWTTVERTDYTLNLFKILAQLLPEGMEGGISTSPLSYRFWITENTDDWFSMRKRCTQNVLRVIAHLYTTEVQTGVYMHLDMEPEPDGVLENGAEFIAWYTQELIPAAGVFFKNNHDLDAEQAAALVKRYLQLCYDICHFAVAYEDHEAILKQLADLGIGIGKFQISAALRIPLSEDLSARDAQKKLLSEFDEPIYLHQVVAQDEAGTLTKYRDLSDALPSFNDLQIKEWRSHFHVPIFLDHYGSIASTQSDIATVLALQKLNAISNHLEVETYTWNVLPEALQIPIEKSIVRELLWVKDQL